MAQEHSARSISAHSIQVGETEAWLHIPVLLPDHLPRLSAWKPIQNDVDFKNHTYFHSYVSGAIWGSETKPVFDAWSLPEVAGRTWMGIREPQTPGGTATVFCGSLKQIEFRKVAGNPFRDLHKALGDTRQLAIITIGMTIETCTSLDGTPEARTPIGSLTVPTLAQIQDGLDAVRRVFARYWRSHGPGDCLSAFGLLPVDTQPPADTAAMAQVLHDPMILQPANSMEEMQAQFLNKATDSACKKSPRALRTPRLPWIEKLIQKLCDPSDVEFFGDERAFTTSVIGLLPQTAEALAAAGFAVPPDPDNSLLEKLTYLSVHPGDHYRLAELDRASDSQDNPNAGWNYTPEFLREAGSEWLYRRHDVDPKTQCGNGTMHYITRHHLGAMTSAFFANDSLKASTQTYYRHMQFLAVFEYYRLLRFSQWMASLVELDMNEDPSKFRKTLKLLRQAFLRHVHLHHFSQVTSQIQPAEMYSRLRGAMGIDALNAEVEQEMAAAADYAAQCDATDSAERAERLTMLAAIFLPLSFLTGVLGMNLWVGERFPGQLGDDINRMGAYGQLLQTTGWAAATLLLTAAVWFCVWRKDTTRITMLGFAGLLFAAFTIGLGLRN